MKKPIDISIITVNYNGLQNTRELIKSLCQHHVRYSFEIIVVDNGSTQDEAAILQKDYPDISVIRSEQNLGFSGGNNLGIHIANGKCLLFLNNDTLIVDDSLAYLYETLINSPEIGAVSPKIKFAFPPQNIQFAGFTPLSKYTLRNRAIGYGEKDEGQFNTPRTTAFLHGAAMMIKREVIEHIGPMPEIYFLYYEEIDWSTRMTDHGYQLWYEPRCTIYHKESCSTEKDSPLKNYYLARNRLLYVWRNRQGGTRYISLLYLLLGVASKNIILNLLHARWAQGKAIFKGSIDFLLLHHKKENI